MKKSILLLLLGLSGSLNAQDTQFYLGILSSSMTSSDFGNFHISDWGEYGLRSENEANVEGRVHVPLGDYDPAGPTIGGVLGAEVPLAGNVDALLEFQVAIGSVADSYGLFGGSTVRLIDTGIFSLGLSPKVGYMVATADFGAIELIDGYIPPVEIPEGTFTNGDSLSLDMSGPSIQIGITPSLKFSGGFGIMAQLGYDLSLAKDPKILVNDEIEIPMDSQAVVKPDLSGTQAGIRPSVVVSGLYFQVAIIWQ
jgi:hypothetical protein